MPQVQILSSYIRCRLVGKCRDAATFPLQILSKQLIKPATPTPHTLRKYKISALDQCRDPTFIPLIFFYPENNDRAKLTERSKQLQISLSEILTLFYPLAGRYNEDNLFIDCNDEGVEYIEAKVASDLSSVILKWDLDSEQLHHLIPHLYESNTSPLVAVQCNMFECGGLAIGLRISHRTVDGFVLTKFLDGWATACRVGIDKVHSLSFDLAVHLPTREAVSATGKPVPPSYTNLRFAWKTFVFSGLAISNLRKIATGCGEKDSGMLACQQRPSRVQLVTALIWKALIGVEQAKHGQLRPSVITHAINMRGRIDLPISDCCFGNFFRPVTVLFNPDKRINKVELHELASLVGDAITNAITDCSKPKNGDELFMMVETAWRDVQALNRSDSGVQSYAFRSICGMPFYPDFGWGKPTGVRRIKGNFDVVITMKDTRDGDGIEAWIRLAENDLSLFQQDPDIIAFSSEVEQHDDHSTYLRSRY